MGRKWSRSSTVRDWGSSVEQDPGRGRFQGPRSPVRPVASGHGGSGRVVTVTSIATIALSRCSARQVDLLFLVVPVVEYARTATRGAQLTADPVNRDSLQQRPGGVNCDGASIAGPTPVTLAV